MGFPTVTNTFVNGATSDASAVNQNFTDILNGLSDTTKDFSMANGTLAGTMTMNGNVVIGSSSSKTVNFLGSLISSVPVSANNSWDLGGSTLGFKSIYIGAAGGFTTRILAAATSNWTFTFPASTSTTGYILTAVDNAGSTTWSPVSRGPEARQNYAISTSVGSNAMTINLLAGDSTTPSATNPVNILFRNATSATGDSTLVSVTGALSVVVSSGATLGHTSAVNQYIYVWAMNNAGTVELVVSGSRDFDEGTVQNSSAIGAGSTDFITLYGTSGRSNKAIRLLGRVLSNQATAGTYASNSTEISLNSLYWPVQTTRKNDLSIVGDPTAFGTISNSSVWYKRIGDSMYCRGSFIAGTMTANPAFIQLPSGYKIDTAKIQSISSLGHLGIWHSLDVTGPTAIFNGGASAGALFYDGTSSDKLYLSPNATSARYNKANASALVGSNSGFSFDFEIPIIQWRSY